MDAIKNVIVSGANTAAETVDHLTNAKRRDLETVTIDYKGHPDMTTTTGVKIENTDTALKAGERGPTLLEDFHNREKITAFDHERIPERVVHARGAAAHGYFKLHTPIPELTKAAVLNDTSRTTPMFLRFSTVAGSRGSADSVRDVRGFATRFYTEEGNWDIVGNNAPVFFIQESIQFPDLIHALKPEPHNEIPQAQSAHDNAWDWMGLQTQALHMNMWQLSDRTIPRSFRMMQGFGVNTYTFIGTDGKMRFVKFHWEPKLGTHGLVWDEALKLAGQDPDFHRRDLFEAIEAGAYPSWEFGVQIIEAENEHDFEFDILDATKLWPEELVPVKFIGTMTLNRNTDDYFAETEQVAFCTSNVVPGIGFSNDPLLHGRNHSYLDTQISRLGINFHSLPINKPVCPVMNHIRDGQASHKIHKSRVNYHPNRFDSPATVPEDKGGYVHFPEQVSGPKVRARGPKFQEHIKQAQMFFNSMSPIEKKHIIQAASFELGKCEDEHVQQKMLENLNLVNRSLAEQVADELCLDVSNLPLPAVNTQTTDFVSMVTGRRNTFTAEGRKIGIYIMDGFDVKAMEAIQAAIVGAKAMAMLVGEKQKIKSAAGVHKCEFTFETSRSTHFDAIVIMGGAGDYQSKLNVGRLKHAALEAYGHHKAIFVQGQAVQWLTDVCLPGQGLSIAGDSGVSDGVVYAHTTPGPSDIANFINLVANHRVWDRDTSTVAF